MVDVQVQEITIKMKVIIVYKDANGEEWEQILLVSNYHTTPYTISEKKIEEILLSLWS
jgi:hypothetical protein